MKIKVALGVVVSLTAITLNAIPTEKEAKMVIENEIICEIEKEKKQFNKKEKKQFLLLTKLLHLYIISISMH